MKMQIALAASALLLAAAPAGATIVIGTGPGVLQPPENVLFNNNPPNGTTVTGVTNQTATSVSIRGGETLVGNGGQARVEALDGLVNTTGSAFGGLPASQLAFDLTNPALGFTSTEFRIFVGSGTATTATLTFLDTAGQTFSNTFDILPNGFFTALATNGETIDKFSFTTNGSFEDVRQVRLGGIASLPSALVPEPMSWALMIFGFGGIGAIARRRRALGSPVAA
jgi:hypothetical protein